MAKQIKRLALGVFAAAAVGSTGCVNMYASNPNTRMDQLLNQSEDYRQIGEFWRRVLAKVEARHAPGRLKQWLGMLRRNFPRAEILYAELRAQKDPLVVAHILGCHGVPVLKAAA